MREIKFRAWDKTEKRMSRSFSLGDNIYFKLKNSNLWWIEGSLINNKHWKERLIFIQYTGLKDKNKKEIYDSDYLKMFLSKYEVIVEVVWHNYKWLFKSVEGEGGVGYFDFGYGEKLEIIGNKYEKRQNPELTKGG